ncbi:hypothetical protein BM1_09659 [Bipolaris maydis]|nr:hypothetical protein BM1_09659 [Bipolaris maydis]
MAAQEMRCVYRRGWDAPGGRPNITPPSHSDKARLARTAKCRVRSVLGWYDGMAWLMEPPLRCHHAHAAIIGRVLMSWRAKVASSALPHHPAASQRTIFFSLQRPLPGDAAAAAAAAAADAAARASPASGAPCSAASKDAGGQPLPALPRRPAG